MSGREPPAAARLTADEVRRVAALARLPLEEEEIGTMAARLDAILGHVEVLGRVDSAEPGGDAPDAAPSGSLRSDDSSPDALRRPPEAVAPAWVDPFFVVPRLSALDVDARSGA